MFLRLYSTDFYKMFTFLSQTSLIHELHYFILQGINASNKQLFQINICENKQEQTGIN